MGLARHFDYSISLEGARAECGVLRGFSALLLARVANMRNPDFDEQGLHLIDSFEGLSAPSPVDAIGSKRTPDGNEEPVYSHQAGRFATSMDFVKSIMDDFPASGIHKGWIPEALVDLPETNWAFVHIDVDIYESTKACLDYFLPRMSPGGVIVNDDFESPWFPGYGIGWHESLDSKGLSYVALDTGQAVYIHNS